ncbi:DUF835 domain-containing protein [Thermococcus sp. Bubb.Bath]|nr:DUF835 domain-containing protein [Thermococcus sp. Bubb.Bath]
MLEILNLIVRLLVWGLATYRWWKRREDFMFLLSLAIWVDVLAALSKRAVLADIGLKPKTTALAPLMSILAIIEGVLLITASLLVLDRIKELWSQFALLTSTTLGSLYVLMATLLSESSKVISAVPVPFLGISLMFTGYILLRKDIDSKKVAALFPIGIFLLGGINITYPLTVDTPLARCLYGMGALFRGMMLIGMLNYAFMRVTLPEMPIMEFPTGAFYTTNGKIFERLLWKMQSSGNGVFITRKSVQEFKPKFPVFWSTMVASGMLDENVVAVSPTDIGILIDRIRRYLEKGHSLVVLDGFEYLVLENGFESALKFLLSLKDSVISGGGTLVVLLEPRALSKKQLRIIQREFEEFKF